MFFRVGGARRSPAPAGASRHPEHCPGTSGGTATRIDGERRVLGCQGRDEALLRSRLRREGEQWRVVPAGRRLTGDGDPFPPLGNTGGGTPSPAQSSDGATAGPAASSCLIAAAGGSKGTRHRQVQSRR